MKKILLSIMALLMSASMVFGHNKVGDLMDTLTAPNRFKARFDEMGVLFGTDTLRFSVGMSLDSKLFSNGDGKVEGDNKLRLGTSPFVSFGYKTPAFGVAVGYQFYNVYKKWTMHAPGLALTFMDNNLRILIPVRIASGRNDFKNSSALDLGPDGVWVRYNTGVEALPQIRVYAAYGSFKASKELVQTKVPGTEDGSTVSSFGAQLRVYLKKFMFGDVGVQPQVRVYFDTALSDLEATVNGKKVFYGSSYSVKGDRNNYMSDPTTPGNPLNKDYKKPIHMQVRIPVEITAANDVVDFYLVPDIRFDMVTGKTEKDVTTKKNATYSLGYNFYSELTFFATENLSFYLETQFGGYMDHEMNTKSGLMFAGNAGLTWNF